jgi:hypothetical protein
MYPYATAGIATIDWNSAGSKFVYGRPQRVAADMRRRECVGLKGVVLDPDFKNNHGVGPSDFRDTILTDPEIDWHDIALAGRGALAIVTNTFPWGDDEFFDANISSRTTDWAPQNCNDPAAPNGLCVEPMFRGLARFDWLREFKWSHGEPDWPDPDPDSDPPYWDDEGPGQKAMDDTCGTSALIGYERADGLQLKRGSSRTNGKVYGFFSYKMTEDKPGGRPDVFWGFDPYRFDSDQMQDAIRWVLSRNFGLIVKN